MVLVFSAHANASSQIKREVERAVDKDVYIIPFRIDDIEPKKSLEYFISTSQWMDAFTPPLEQHLERLVRAVRTILADSTDKRVQAVTKPDPVSPAEISKPIRERVSGLPVWFKPVAILLGSLIIAGAIGYSLWQQRAHFGETKRNQGAVMDPGLLDLPSALGSSPRSSNPAVNRPEDHAGESGVANQPANTRNLPPSSSNNAARETDRILPNPEEESAPPDDEAGQRSPMLTPANKSNDAPAASSGSRAARDLNNTTWKHNDSTVTLKKDGSRVSFVYRSVRPGLQGMVAVGATLFEGVAVGDRYSGKARRFKKGLPPIEYEVSGGLRDGGRAIELNGKSPKRDASGSIMVYENENLRFELMEAAE